MKHRTLPGVGVWLAMSFAACTADAGSDPAGACAAAKRKAVGKYAFETLKCHADAARGNVPVKALCLERSAARLTGSFARAEQRGGCATTGDASTLQAQVDLLVNAAVALLPSSPPTLDCTGASVGGHCWYDGPVASCDAVCAAVSRTYDPATESFAGSGGSDENCALVAGAVFGIQGPYPAVNSSICSEGVGCGWTPSVFLPVVHRCATPVTTGSAAYSGFGRFCACS